MKKINIKFIKISCFLFLLFFSLNIVLANNSMLPDTEGGVSSVNGTANCAGYLSSNCGNYTLNEMVSVVVKYYNRMLMLIGSIAFVMFIYGGVKMIISSGNNEKVSDGQKTILGAVFGLVVVFASFMLVQFVMDALGIEQAKGGRWATSDWFKK